VDQLPLRLILPAIYLAESAMFAGLALLSSSFVLAPVLLLACLDGGLMLTARGLTRGAVNAVLTPRDLLREGNALLNVAFAASNVGGSALGGLLVSLSSTTTALWVDAASFAPIAIIYARKTLGTDEAGFGLLLATWGAGVVLGSMLFVAIKRQSTRVLVLGSTLAIGVAYSGMAISRELWLACAFSVIGGAGNGIQWVAVMTALQEATPADLQARITGLLESVASAMTGVGFLLGGIVTALFSPATAFAIAGGGLVFLVLLAALKGAAALPGTPSQPVEVQAVVPPGPAPSGMQELRTP
jgi:predicted MFS family arabinose efflux permease